MTKLTNKQARTFFAKRQKIGDITKLVKLTNYSQPHVSNVLAGRRYNETILNEATKLVSRRKINA